MTERNVNGDHMLIVMKISENQGCLEILLAGAGAGVRGFYCQKVYFLIVLNIQIIYNNQSFVPDKYTKNMNILPVFLDIPPIT